MTLLRRLSLITGIIGLTACSGSLLPTPSMIASLHLIDSSGNERIQATEVDYKRFERATPDTPSTVNVLRYINESASSVSLGFVYLPLAENVQLSVRHEAGYELSVDVDLDFDNPTALGKAGDKYELVISNMSTVSYELVTTVDGNDVISEGKGNDANSGYLILPGEELVINGFYKDQKKSIPFRFQKVPKNINTADHETNVKTGAIRLALFSALRESKTCQTH